MTIDDKQTKPKTNKSNADSRMDSTMSQIQAADDLLTQTKKDDVLKEILDLENDIKAQGLAQAEFGVQNSPEMANKLQRDLIFMKRNLEKKKSELEAFGS